MQFEMKKVTIGFKAIVYERVFRFESDLVESLREKSVQSEL